MIRKFNLLFVCNSNVSRSPLAASLFEGSVQYEARSAGINPIKTLPDVTSVPVTQSLIDWADSIFVMDEENERQESILRERFNVGDKKITVLGVPDKYNIGLAGDFNELKGILEKKLKGYFV